MKPLTAGVPAPRRRHPGTRSLRAILAALFLLAGACPALASDSTGAGTDAAPYLWQELAPGVWAGVQPPAFHFRESNSLVVAGEAASLVVDAQGDPGKVEWLVGRAGRALEAAGGGPVRYLVLSHWHGDHTHGSGAWQRAFPGLAVVGHRSLWRDVPGRTVPALADDRARLEEAIGRAEERLAAGEGEDGEPLTAAARTDLGAGIARARERAGRMAAIRVPVPDIGVDRRLELSLGGEATAPRVVLLHLPGHSDGDLVAWLPAERILAGGDLLDALPFGGHGDPSRWTGSLEALAELPFETLVPGHGPVLHGAAARRHLERITGWLRFIAAEAAAAVVREESAEAALAGLAAGADWRRWRGELTGWPGDEDSVARFGRAFDAFAPETFTRAVELAREGVAGRGEGGGESEAAEPAP